MIVSPRSARGPRPEHEPTTIDLAWRARANEFGREVMLPLAQLIDRLGVSAAGSGLPLREFVAQARDEGFTRLCERPEHGGVGLSRAGEYIVLEELATADAGLAGLLIAAPVPFRWARDARGPRFRDLYVRYLEGVCPDWSGCLTAAAGPRLRATQSGGGWLLDGRAGAVLGAAIATHGAVRCSIDAGGSTRVALAIVELERPGITRRHEPEPLGLHGQCRAELLFEDVFVSGEELLFIGPPGLGWLAGAAALDQLIGAISAIGIARSAYRAASRFAREQLHAGATVQERRTADRLLTRLSPRLCHVRRSTGAAHLQRGLNGAPDEPGALEQASVGRVLATEVALEIVDATSQLVQRATNARGELEFLDGSKFWLDKLRRDARSLGDPGARFAVAGPEPARPTRRRIEWTQPSSLASG